MKYRALRTLNGDYGHVNPGEVFEVPDYQERDMQPLEARGIITRVRPAFNRSAYTVTRKAVPATKAVTPPENK